MQTFLNCFVKGLFLVSFLLVTNLLYGQTDQVNELIAKPVSKSPNAASLGRYGDYEVSLFSGLPEISIPITEVKSGVLSIPITLNYHASGIKYNDQASWVGLGWSLTSGGQITRSYEGAPDEEFYTTHTVVNDASVCTTYDYIKSIADGITDTQPDLFSYSSTGATGKFYLGQQGQSPFLIPYRPIKIAPTFSGPQIKKIEITDESGILHRFGETSSGTSVVEYTNSSVGGESKTSATTWYLTEMVAPNSTDKISISYQTNGSSTTSDIVQSYTVIDKLDHYLADDDLPSNRFVQNMDKLTSSSITVQNAPSVILFEGGKIEFVLAQSNRSDLQSTKALDRINIYGEWNGQYILRKTVKFVYSYFSNSSVCDGSQPGTLNLRLKLDEVLFLDNQNVIVQRYKLTYYTNTFSWDRKHSSFKRDYWGYYNGRSNTGLIPYKTIAYQHYLSSPVQNIAIGLADRSTNPTYLTEGVLKSIEFPTGGLTEFNYEPHQYKDPDGTTGYAGGLRVSSILSRESDNARPLIKTYKYGENESGYGVKNFLLTDYAFEITSAFHYEGLVDVSYVDYRIRTYVSNSTMDLNRGEGSTVVYPLVTSYKGTVNDNVGKEVYNFSFVPDAQINSVDAYKMRQHSSKYYLDRMDWRRGKLLRKIVYDKHGTKLSSSTNRYALVSESMPIIGILASSCNIYTGGDNMDGGGGCVDAGNQSHYGDEYAMVRYYQSSGAMVQDQSIDSIFSNAGWKTSARNVTYDQAKLEMLETRETTANPSEELVTVHKYPFSYPGLTSSSSGNVKALKLLNDKNILGAVVEKYSYLQNTDGSNKRLVGAALNTYKLNTNDVNQVVGDEAFLLEIEKPLVLTNFTPSSVNGTQTSVIKDTRYISRVGYSKFNSSGDIVEINKRDDVSSSYVWGYGGTLPIAEAINAASDKIFHTSFEDEVNGSTTAFTGKRSRMGSYTVMLPSAGTYVLSYWAKVGSSAWAYFEIPNVTANYTISVSGGIIDEVRLYPSTARMTTYTYEPGLGISSVTDAANIPTFYVYDDFGRLAFIKDIDGKILKTHYYHYKK